MRPSDTQQINHAPDSAENQEEIKKSSFFENILKPIGWLGKLNPLGKSEKQKFVDTFMKNAEQVNGRVLTNEELIAGLTKLQESEEYKNATISNETLDAMMPGIMDIPGMIIDGIRLKRIEKRMEKKEEKMNDFFKEVDDITNHIEEFLNEKGLSLEDLDDISEEMEAELDAEYKQKYPEMDARFDEVFNNAGLVLLSLLEDIIPVVQIAEPFMYKTLNKMIKAQPELFAINIDDE